MSALLHRFILAGSMVGAYVWLQIPELRPLSLQVFCVALVIYFLLKRLKKADLWQVAPSVLSWEMPIVTFALLLLVGYTGGSTSLLFPLSFVLLFFWVFSTELATAVSMTLLMMVFYYSLGFHQTWADISNLLALPILLGFFVFAKLQYVQATQGKTLLKTEAIALAHSQSSEAALEKFLTSYLEPQLEQLQRLLAYPHHNQQPLQNLITTIQIEVQKQIRSQPPARPVAPPVVNQTPEVNG